MWSPLRATVPPKSAPSSVPRAPIEKTFVDHVKLGGVASQDERPNNVELPADTPSGHFNIDPYSLHPPRSASTTVSMKTLAAPQDTVTASSSASHNWLCIIELPKGSMELSDGGSTVGLCEDI